MAVVGLTYPNFSPIRLFVDLYVCRLKLRKKKNNKTTAVNTEGFLRFSQTTFYLKTDNKLLLNLNN